MARESCSTPRLRAATVQAVFDQGRCAEQIAGNLATDRCFLRVVIFDQAGGFYFFIQLASSGVTLLFQIFRSTLQFFQIQAICCVQA